MQYKNEAKFELDSFMKVTKSITYLPKLNKKELWHTFKLEFERVSKTQRFHRILDTAHKTKAAFEATLQAESLDLKFFIEQFNYADLIFDKIINRIKGRDIICKNPNDPVSAWKKLCEYHKGSDTALEAASNLILQIFQLNPNKFRSMCRFLTEYDVSIENYNNTNSDATPNSMKLQFLNLYIRHCPKLYVTYSNWLTSQRTTTVTSCTTLTPH